MTPLEYDRARIWHPYAPLGNPPPVRMAKAASGTDIILDDGRRLVDAVSSWWCVAHGHNRPEITGAIRRQSERLSHVMFGGFTHEPAVELAERLAAIAPDGLDRVFFADSGSISVEVACKMAVQYHAALGRPRRCRIVALKGGYHGDTSLCMSISDPDGMHTLFKGIMSRQFFAEKPTTRLGGKWRADDISSLERILLENGDEVAAVICEPVFQAANAMWFYDAEYLRQARRLCDATGTLLVYDEIAAGFYRTGPRWAHERSGTVPDIMTVGKALTGGHMTLAATLVSGKVADTVSGGSPGAFMHGPTYMANPLACAAACASLDIFGKNDYEAMSLGIGEAFRRELSGAECLLNVADVRIEGAVAVLEMRKPPRRDEIERTIDAHGVWLRPFGNFIYSMPPLVTDGRTVARIAGAMLDLAASPPGETDSSGFHE